MRDWLYRGQGPRLGGGRLGPVATKPLLEREDLTAHVRPTRTLTRWLISRTLDDSLSWPSSGERDFLTASKRRVALERFWLIAGWVAPTLATWGLSRVLKRESRLLGKARTDLELAGLATNQALAESFRLQAHESMCEALKIRSARPQQRTWYRLFWVWMIALPLQLLLPLAGSGRLQAIDYVLLAISVCFTVSAALFCWSKYRQVLTAVDRRELHSGRRVAMAVLLASTVAVSSFLAIVAVRDYRVGQMLEVEGTVACFDDGPVSGVWVKVEEGKSGWARWTPINGTQASFSYRRSRVAPWTVNAGCGGGENWTNGAEFAIGERRNWQCVVDNSSAHYGCRLVR